MPGKRIRFVLLLTLFVMLIFSGIFWLLQDGAKNELPLAQVSLAHDKGLVSSFQTLFKRQGERSIQDTGIAINPLPSKITEVYINQMKSILSTSEAPELFTWWSTYRVEELVKQGLVADITSLWDRHQNEYPKGLRQAFTFENRVYGFPYIIEYWAVWYNKTIFRKLRLNEPKTWEEFLQICETLKANQITPILSSLQDKWPAFIWFEEMIIGEDPDLYVDLCEGRIKYTHPRVKKAFNLWGQLIRKGYFSDPAARMFTNAGHLWRSGKIGMVLCGSWYPSSALLEHEVEEKEIGVFILPSHNPSAGNNIIVEALPIFLAKNAKNAKAAMKVADWWLGPEGSGFSAKQALAFSGNNKVDTSYLPTVKRILSDRIKTENYRILNRYWEATPTPICDYSVDKFAEFFLAPERVDSILNDIENFAAAYWKTRRPTRGLP